MGGGRRVTGDGRGVTGDGRRATGDGNGNGNGNGKIWDGAPSAPSNRHLSRATRGEHRGRRRRPVPYSDPFPFPFPAPAARRPQPGARSPAPAARRPQPGARSRLRALRGLLRELRVSLSIPCLGSTQWTTRKATRAPTSRLFFPCGRLPHCPVLPPLRQPLNRSTRKLGTTPPVGHAGSRRAPYHKR